MRHSETEIEDGGRSPGPQLTEFQVVVLAAVVWGGARLALAVPLLGAVALVAIGLLGRRPTLVIVSIGLTASSLGHRAVDAFQPVEAGAYAGRVTLVDQPRAAGLGWRVDVRLDDGRRVEASGFGSAGFELSRASAGDTLHLEGRLRPVADRGWTRARHLLGRLSVTEAGMARGPTGPRVVVELLRGAVADPARLVPEDVRALYLGLVIGDDGRQPPAQRERFRASGLSHLQAVSGQNVAFVLAVVRPASLMLGRRTRLGFSLLVLLSFAMATRLEPSVLRATMTGGLAAVASFEGQRQSGMRLLGLAVSMLVLIDPFLVYSIGFRLSVAASAGILLITPVLVDRLPGPSLVRQPLAVTLGAQLAVSPLLIATFGSVPSASIPANLLAGWAAGMVMMLGLTVGPAADLLGGPMGEWLQLPAAWLLRWIDGVASWGSTVPAPILGPTTGPLLVALVALAWVLWGRSPRALFSMRRLAALTTIGLTLAAAVLATPGPVVTEGGSFVDLDGGGSWHSLGRGERSILVVHPNANERLLSSVIDARIGRIDLLIVRSGRGQGAAVASEIMSLKPTGVVLAPSLHRIIGATRVTGQLSIGHDPAWPIEVYPDGPNRLMVSVSGRVIDGPPAIDFG